MNILVAGANGVIGRQLVPQLVARGHRVTGTTHNKAKQALIREMGAIPAVLDPLDPEDVARVVAGSEPDVIVHQLTALSEGIDIKHFDESFALTNRLRTDGTDNLLAAAQAVGVDRFIAQSYAGWPSGRSGAAVKSEDDPLDPSPLKGQQKTFDAIRHLEDAVTGAAWTKGIVLRYGSFYGPGTSLDVNGENTEQIRDRKFPILGDAGGIWSFIHVRDAADATIAAIGNGEPGIYNIVDDDPAPVREWLPEVAEAVGGKPPRRLPVWLGRILAGEVASAMITEVRGASNAKAREKLDWVPPHPTWRGQIAREA